jgi:hypothetical protein
MHGYTCTYTSQWGPSWAAGIRKEPVDIQVREQAVTAFLSLGEPAMGATTSLTCSAGYSRSESGYCSAMSAIKASRPAVCCMIAGWFFDALLSWVVMGPVALGPLLESSRPFKLLKRAQEVPVGDGRM